MAGSNHPTLRLSHRIERVTNYKKSKLSRFSNPGNLRIITSSNNVFGDAQKSETNSEVVNVAGQSDKISLSNEAEAKSKKFSVTAGSQSIRLFRKRERSRRSRRNKGLNYPKPNENIKNTKLNENNQLNPIENVNKPKPNEIIDKPKPIEKVNKLKPIEKVNKPKPIEKVNKPKPVEKVNKPKPVERVNKPKPIENVNKPKPIEKVNKPKPIEKVNKPKPSENVNKSKPNENSNKPKPNENTNKPKPIGDNKKPNLNQNLNKVKPNESFNKNKKASDKLKPNENLKKSNPIKNYNDWVPLVGFQNFNVPEQNEPRLTRKQRKFQKYQEKLLTKYNKKFENPYPYIPKAMRENLDDISDAPLEDEDLEEVEVASENEDHLNNEFSVGFRKCKPSYLKGKDIGFFRPKIYNISADRTLIICKNEMDQVEEEVDEESDVIEEVEEVNVVTEEDEEANVTEEVEEVSVVTEEVEDNVVTEEVEDNDVTEEVEDNVVTEEVEDNVVTEEVEDNDVTEEVEEHIVTEVVEDIVPKKVNTVPEKVTVVLEDVSAVSEEICAVSKDIGVVSEKVYVNSMAEEVHSIAKEVGASADENNDIVKEVNISSEIHLDDVSEAEYEEIDDEEMMFIDDSEEEEMEEEVVDEEESKETTSISEKAVISLAHEKGTDLITESVLSKETPDLYQEKAVFQDSLDAWKSHLIGMEYILEIWNKPGGQVNNYYCMLCREDISMPEPFVTNEFIAVHISNIKHMSLYIEKHFPSCGFKLTDDAPNKWSSVLKNNCEEVESNLSRQCVFITNQDYFRENLEAIKVTVENSTHWTEKKCMLDKKKFSEVAEIPVVEKNQAAKSEEAIQTTEEVFKVVNASSKIDISSDADNSFENKDVIKSIIDDLVDEVIKEVEKMPALSKKKPGVVEASAKRKKIVIRKQLGAPISSKKLLAEKLRIVGRASNVKQPGPIKKVNVRIKKKVTQIPLTKLKGSEVPTDCLTQPTAIPSNDSVQRVKKTVVKPRFHLVMRKKVGKVKAVQKPSLIHSKHCQKRIFHKTNTTKTTDAAVGLNNSAMGTDILANLSDISTDSEQDDAILQGDLQKDKNFQHATRKQPCLSHSNSIKLYSKYSPKVAKERSVGIEGLQKESTKIVVEKRIYSHLNKQVLKEGSKTRNQTRSRSPHKMKLVIKSAEILSSETKIMSTRRKSKSPLRRRSRSPRKHPHGSPCSKHSLNISQRSSRSPAHPSRSSSRQISKNYKKQDGKSSSHQSSRSPKRRSVKTSDRHSRSPKRQSGQAPASQTVRSVTRHSRSPRKRKSKSPFEKLIKSLERQSRYSFDEHSRSPTRRRSRSPARKRSRSPARKRSRSPARKGSRSPARKRSRSPFRRHSRSPVSRRSRSPTRRRSRSPFEKRHLRSPAGRYSSNFDRHMISSMEKRSRSPLDRSSFGRSSNSPGKRLLGLQQERSLSPLKKRYSSSGESVSIISVGRRSPPKGRLRSPGRSLSRSPGRDMFRNVKEHRSIRRVRSPLGSKYLDFGSMKQKVSGKWSDNDLDSIISDEDESLYFGTKEKISSTTEFSKLPHASKMLLISILQGISVNNLDPNDPSVEVMMQFFDSNKDELQQFLNQNIANSNLNNLPGAQQMQSNVGFMNQHVFSSPTMLPGSNCSPVSQNAPSTSQSRPPTFPFPLNFPPPAKMPPSLPNAFPNQPRFPFPAQNQQPWPPNQLQVPHNQLQIPSNQHQMPPNQHQMPPNQLQMPPNQHQLPPNQHQLPPNQHQLPPNQHQLPPNQHQLPPNQHHLAPNQHHLAPNQHHLAPNQLQIPPNQFPMPPNQFGVPPNQFSMTPNQLQMPPIQQLHKKHHMHPPQQSREEVAARQQQMAQDQLNMFFLGNQNVPAKQSIPTEVIFKDLRATVSKLFGGNKKSADNAGVASMMTSQVRESGQRASDLMRQPKSPARDFDYRGLKSGNKSERKEVSLSFPPPDAKVSFCDTPRIVHQQTLFPVVSEAGSSKSTHQARQGVNDRKISLAQRLASVLINVGMIDVPGHLLQEMLNQIGAFNPVSPQDITESDILYILRKCGYLH